MDHEEVLKIQEETLKNIKKAKRLIEKYDAQQREKKDKNYGWFLPVERGVGKGRPHVILLDGERIKIGTSGKMLWNTAGAAKTAATNRVMEEVSRFLSFKSGLTKADLQAAKEEWMKEHIEILPYTKWIERIKNGK